MIPMKRPRRCLKMSDEEDKIQEEITSSELELDGKIFLLGKNADGHVISRSELDGELCLKVVIAVLDDRLKSNELEELLQAREELVK